MYYLTIRQTAEKWNISVRSVQNMCKNGLIHGAYKWGNSWKIPDDAERPADKRRGALHHQIFMPRKTPFLNMTNLYHTAGMADECGNELSDNPEARLLFEAEVAYSRGEIDKVYSHANEILNIHTDFFFTIAGGMLLSLCAIWRGDIDLWKRAKRHISEAPCKSEIDHELIHLAHASADSAIRNMADFPDWFRHGCFGVIPADAFPAAKVFYIKYLMEMAFSLAVGNVEYDDVKGLALMKTLPYIIEPMVAQTKAERVVIAELYLRLLCAISYKYIGDIESAVSHLDKAIEIALADKLLGTLAEHRRYLGSLLDDRLNMADPYAFKCFKELHRQISDGWHSLHNRVMEKSVAINLSDREREISTLAAFGFSNVEISEKLHISVNSVKSIISMAMNKTGAINRYDLKNYI